MREFTCEPELDVLGQNMRAFIDNLQAVHTRPIMVRYGIAEPNPDEWYPAGLLMEIFNEIAETPEVMFNLVAIGMGIGEIMQFTKYTDPTLEQALMDWNSSYQAIHRNGDAGDIRVEKISDTHFKVSFTDLYPDDFSYGILYGYGQRFLRPGINFKVAYDPDVTPRDQGGQGPTVIHISW